MLSQNLTRWLPIILKLTAFISPHYAHTPRRILGNYLYVIVDTSYVADTNSDAFGANR